jgi:hypothetical protein
MMAEEFGDLCGECYGPLNRKGYCKDRRCPFHGYWQDELVPPSVRREKQQVVGNPRSKKAYPYGSIGYKRNLGSAQTVIFNSDTEAEQAGYEVQDG